MHINSGIALAKAIAIMTLVSGCASTIDRGNFGPFQRSLNNTSHGYQVVTDPTGTANSEYVERFEVRNGDCTGNEDWSDCDNDRERSELSEKNKTTTPGKEYWYRWDIYFPEDYVNIYPTKTALAQFHQKSGHVVWMFQNSDGGYHLDQQVTGSTERYYELISEEDLRGKWHQIEVHANWEKNDSGFLKVWVNGEQKVDYSGRTMTAKAVYFKYGIYRSYMSRYKSWNNTDTVPTQTVYYSNVARATDRQSLAN
ncbi:polysaccharide lyase [Vibrio ulleungensis]|uniref:Polysaccharide lyase n=1 Tax=Vibrio ulleungensis TaxID=2807619 RepID=A0ABS2HH79_9VIBR|nr:polysaccharide lyase [Vibrio ulleungensis]MBM7035447.1 polysaccharide lyase [Vibrio ulleungensis]